MKGAVGVSMHVAGVPKELARTPYEHEMRIVVQFWWEWMKDGQRETSRKLSSLGRYGQVSAAASMLMGCAKYGIRHGAEVVIPQRPNRKRPGGIRVSRLYIDNRPVVGEELKSLLAQVLVRTSKRKAASDRRVAKLDRDLARIR